MDIKDGYFATLSNGTVYEVVSTIKDKNGNYRLRSTNPDDLNNGFTKYANEDRLFIKDVPESQVEKIKCIRTYATLKNDPGENKFEVINKIEDLKKDNKLMLVTTNRILAEKFSFNPFGVLSDETFMKIVSENDINIKYKVKEYPINNAKKNYNNLDVKKALTPMSKKTPPSNSLNLALNSKNPIALI